MLTAVLIALDVVLVVLVAVAWRSGVRRERRLAETVESLAKASDGLAEELATRFSQQLEEWRTGEGEHASALLDRISTLEGAMSELTNKVSELPPPAPPGLDEEAVRPLIAAAQNPVEERLDRIEQELARAAEVTDSAGAPDTPAARGVIEDLARRGYRDVRVLGAPRQEGSETRVAVEARREGMTFKGHVVLDEGRVEECRLSPSWPMFP